MMKRIKKFFTMDNGNIDDGKMVFALIILSLLIYIILGIFCYYHPRIIILSPVIPSMMALFLK